MSGKCKSASPTATQIKKKKTAKDNQYYNQLREFRLH
jgi:hypothetical protein